MIKRFRHFFCSAALSLSLIGGIFAPVSAVSASEVTETSAESGSETSGALSAITAGDLVNALKDTFSGETFPNGTTRYNFLFIGTDLHDSSWDGNSDSMILVSLNKDTQKIYMMSFMRDLSAEIPGYGTRKLNAANAIGGAELLMTTITGNFGVSIDNYVSVDFSSLAEIIDSLGGVEITVEEAEIPSLNMMANQMAAMRGVEAPEELPGAGTYNLVGDQAVAYARIRKIGNNDYQRTERQRTVLEKMFEKVKTMTGSDLTAFATSVLNIVSTDLTIPTTFSLASQVPELLTYSIEESRVPYDGMYHSDNERLVPDQPATNERIQEELNS